MRRWRCSYDIYREDSIALPLHNRERQKIAEYFYKIGETPTFKRIACRIRNDIVETDIAIMAIHDGNLEIVVFMCETIRSAEHLSRIAVEMIDLGLRDSKELRAVIDTVRTKNEAELRKIAVHLFDRHQEDTGLFHHIIDLMTNMAEVRKVAMHFVENRRFDSDSLDEIIEKFRETNRAELRKVALEFIKQGACNSREFSTIMDILVSKNPQYAIPVLEELRKLDQSIVEKYYRDCLSDISEDNAALIWLKTNIGRQPTSNLSSGSLP